MLKDSRSAICDVNRYVIVDKLRSFRALNYNNPDEFYNITDVDTLSIECSNCSAIKFPMETEPLCCLKGNVQLDAFLQPPVFLQHLYEGVDSKWEAFSANIHNHLIDSIIPA